MISNYDIAGDIQPTGSSVGQSATPLQGPPKGCVIAYSRGHLIVYSI